MPADHGQDEHLGDVIGVLLDQARGQGVDVRGVGLEPELPLRLDLDRPLPAEHAAHRPGDLHAGRQARLDDGVGELVGLVLGAGGGHDDAGGVGHRALLVLNEKGPQRPPDGREQLCKS